MATPRPAPQTRPLLGRPSSPPPPPPTIRGSRTAAPARSPRRGPPSRPRRRAGGAGRGRGGPPPAPRRPRGGGGGASARVGAPVVGRPPLTLPKGRRRAEAAPA